jgi:NADP-dependent 3-hydroxy acid dehydrogenase YdfG
VFLLAKRYKDAREKVSLVQVQKKAKAILAQRDMLKTFEDIRALGSNVYYYSCDVSSKEDMAKTITAIQSEVGTITGVVHGAGVIFDQKIYNKNIDNFKIVYDAKYKGINYIMDNVDKDRLKFLVMFSSVAGYFGNDGQSDYAAGNEYLDKCAYYLNKKYPDCKTLAINWGAWDGGMMDATYRKALKERGHILIPLEVGANYFVNEFLMGLPSRQIMFSYDGEMGI